MAKNMRRQGRIRNHRFMVSLPGRLQPVSLAALVTTWTVATCFATSGSAQEPARLVVPPAVVHAIGAGSTQPNGKTVPIPGNNTGDPTAVESSQVILSAGILDGVFGGNRPKVAKKEHEDGRKATPLSPPDPSGVNWSGIPFHKPAPPTEKIEANKSQPIRDYTGSGVTRPVASPRTTTPLPSANANLRRTPGDVTTPSKAISSTNRNVPPVPPAPLNPTQPSSKSASSSAPTQLSKPTYSSDISAIESTRRTGRRAINALDPESMVLSPNDESQVPSESTSLTEPLPAPSVPRRELMPIESSIDRMAKVGRSDIETLPELPKLDTASKGQSTIIAVAPEKSDIPMVPSSKRPSTDLLDSWNSVGSGISRSTQTPARPVSSPVATSAPSISEPAAETSASNTPGPSAQSERALRDSLLASKEKAANETAASVPALTPSTSAATTPASPAMTTTVARKPESVGKQLGSSESPGVRVITEGPSEIMIRELTQYEVRVENRGSFDANGIIVRSSLPPWAEVQGNNASIGTVKTVDQSGQAQLQWTINKLPAGVVERLFIRVKAVKAGAFDVTTDWTIMPQKYVASVTVREPKLSVVIDGPDEIVFGRSEKYRVRVMNPGDGDASNVVFTLSPDSKNPQSQKIGSIPAGKEAQFEIELTARELGELKIGGMATADREVKTTANKSIRIASAAVEAELTGPPLKYQNTNANYHLLLTNTGKAVCEAMEAELRLPLGVTYVSGIPQASVVGDRLAWKIDAMQPGAVREYDLVCKMDRTGDMVIGFNCVGSASGRASVSIETRVEAIADLVLSISDPVAPAPVNTDVVYEMTILNRGSKAAEDVRIVAQFSNGIEPTRVEGHSGEVVTGQALFNPIARIEPGTTVRLKVTARAEKAGDHRFRAEVRHGDTSLVAEEATMYMDAPVERISRRSTNK